MTFEKSQNCSSEPYHLSTQGAQVVGELARVIMLFLLRNFHTHSVEKPSKIETLQLSCLSVPHYNPLRVRDIILFERVSLRRKHKVSYHSWSLTLRILVLNLGLKTFIPSMRLKWSTRVIEGCCVIDMNQVVDIGE